MKKILSILGFALIMMISSVFAAAPTGFHLDNQIDVTGDWKWDNGWVLGEWKTAQFNMNIDSDFATQSSFVEIGSLGNAWNLEYDSEAFINAPVKFINELNVVSVNPPDTTPGTDWTSFSFNQMTGSKFSQSNLSVTGFGDAFVKSKFNLANAGGQTIELDIN
jgi:hypothetical protein